MPRGVYDRTKSKQPKASKVKPLKRRKWRVDFAAEPFGITHEVVKDDITHDKVREEFDITAWINAADTPKERQLRKSAMHWVMYSSLPVNEGSLLHAAQRIRDTDAVGVTAGRWSAEASCQQSNVPKEETNKAWEASAGMGSNPKTLTGQQKVPVLSVVPPASIIAQATAMRYGAFFAPRVDGTRGYGPYNWRDQPIEAHIYIDAAIRHLMQWWDGDEYELILDDEGRVLDEVSHLAFALATIGILIDARANGTCIDDRPRVKNRVATGMLHDHKIETPKK